MSNDLVASADESETGESIVSLESMEHRPFRFLDLPTELRFMIYRHLLLGPRGMLILPSNSQYLQGRAKLQVAILRTCRLINEEATPLLWENTIRLHWDKIAPPFFPSCEDLDFDCEMGTVPKYQAFWESDPFTTVKYQLRDRNVYLHKDFFGFMPLAVFARFSKVEIDINFELQADRAMRSFGQRRTAMLTEWALERVECIFDGISHLEYLARLLERSPCIRELRLNIPVCVIPLEDCRCCCSHDPGDCDSCECEEICDLSVEVSSELIQWLEENDYLLPLFRLRNCEKLVIDTDEMGCWEYEEQVRRTVESNFQELERSVPLSLCAGTDVTLDTIDAEEIRSVCSSLSGCSHCSENIRNRNCSCLCHTGVVCFCHCHCSCHIDTEERLWLYEEHFMHKEETEESILECDTDSDEIDSENEFDNEPRRDEDGYCPCWKDDPFVLGENGKCLCRCKAWHKSQISDIFDPTRFNVIENYFQSIEKSAGPILPFLEHDYPEDDVENDRDYVDEVRYVKTTNLTRYGRAVEK